MVMIQPYTNIPNGAERKTGARWALDGRDPIGQEEMEIECFASAAAGPPLAPPRSAVGKTSPPAKKLCKPAAPSPAKKRSDWAGEGWGGGQNLAVKAAKLTNAAG